MTGYENFNCKLVLLMNPITKNNSPHFVSKYIEWSDIREFCSNRLELHQTSTQFLTTWSFCLEQE